MSLDLFSAEKIELDAPSEQAFAITPDNNNDLQLVTRGLYVGGAGDINMIMAGDSAPVLRKNCIAGMVYPWRVKRVLSDNTTATNLIGDL